MFKETLFQSFRYAMLSLFVVFLTSETTLAQAPNKMSYQAVVRNASNTLITNQQVGMRISIIQGSIFGASLYVETQSATTNANGLASLEIGAGTVVFGSFTGITWENGPYFIKTEVDPNGGSNYSITGTSQLLSVPYALYAAKSGNAGQGPQGPKGDTGATGPEGPKGDTGKSSLILTKTEFPGVNCTYGGIKIEIGFDDNINGILEPNEIQSNLTKFVCNGNPVSSGQGGFQHYIGQFFGGGVIFHLWKDETGVEHGLIVDLLDLSTESIWSNSFDDEIGPNAQSSWNGRANSLAIVGQDGLESAAGLCMNSNNGGFDDWYLPAIDELSLLWQNRFNVNKTLEKVGGISLFKNRPYFDLDNWDHHYQFYWSSTENSGPYAWSFDFQTGTAFHYAWHDFNNKHNAWSVRAVRSF
jgi:hypothetical protein